jgi:hypothetical protein
MSGLKCLYLAELAGEEAHGFEEWEPAVSVGPVQVIFEVRHVFKDKNQEAIVLAFLDLMATKLKQILLVLVLAKHKRIKDTLLLVELGRAFSE